MLNLAGGASLECDGSITSNFRILFLLLANIFSAHKRFIFPYFDEFGNSERRSSFDRSILIREFWKYWSPDKPCNYLTLNYIRKSVFCCKYITFTKPLSTRGVVGSSIQSKFVAKPQHN